MEAESYVTQELVDKILGWAPSPTEGAVDEKAKTAAQCTVLSAGPRNDGDLKALGCCYRFFLWCSLHEIASSHDSMTEERVDMFLASLPANTSVGTKDAMRSRLRCCMPGSSFAARAASRRAAMPVAQSIAEVPAEPAATIERPTLSEILRVLIDGWNPRWKNQHAWPAIQEVVREVVKDAVPDRSATAEAWLREIARFAAWQDRESLPVTTKTVLNENRVEAYLDALRTDGYSQGSLNTYRSQFNAVRNRSCVTQIDAVAELPEALSLDGYSEANIEFLRQCASDAQSAKRRRHLHALIILAYEARLSGGLEIGCVTIDDVRATRDGVAVDVWSTAQEHRTGKPQRTVLLPNDGTSGDRLLTIVNEARHTGETYLIGGSNNASQRNRRSSALVGDCNNWPIELNIALLRNANVHHQIRKSESHLQAVAHALGATSDQEFIRLLSDAYGPQTSHRLKRKTSD